MGNGFGDILDFIYVKRFFWFGNDNMCVFLFYNKRMKEIR